MGLFTSNFPSPTIGCASVKCGNHVNGGTLSLISLLGYHGSSLHYGFKKNPGRLINLDFEILSRNPRLYLGVQDFFSRNPRLKSQKSRLYYGIQDILSETRDKVLNPTFVLNVVYRDKISEKCRLTR
eukprot:g4433.t1